ncbi:MAG: hypothetical protein HOP25_02035 [Methylotenera sp.]|nr:hypothetical protein [Methylotenera sp.]
MKFFITLCLLSFLSINAMAQTKEETEAWILKQSELNPQEIKHSIEGNVLISKVTMVNGIGGLGGEPVEKGIPISQITKIVYTHTNEYLSYTMTCDKPCAYLLDEPDEKRPKFLFEIYKKLDSSYVPRMNKALLHLIKLHGGKAKLTKAEASKEAF